MSARDSALLLGAGLCLLCCPRLSLGQPSDAAARDQVLEDKPKIALIQYESGRVLVVREVDGRLQVYEPSGTLRQAVDKYFEPTRTLRAQHQQVPGLQQQPGVQQPGVQQPPGVAAQPGAGPAEEDPFFYSPYWFDPGFLVNVTPPGGPEMEARRQDAAELRQQVQARRQRQGTTGVTNQAGRVYPSTAADAEEDQRLARVQGQSGSPYATFFNLGVGLEYFRQQEVAARKELALLSYDALLDDGLRFFHERQYGQAARSFVAAAQKDRGDAGCRLHAAQALMASGLYAQAMVHVRRAFELSPLLLNKPLNHRTTYTFAADYDRHVAALQQYVQDHPDDDEAAILLAYELFFSDRPLLAREPMRRVKRLARTDRFAWKLYRAAEPVLGRLD